MKEHTIFLIIFLLIIGSVFIFGCETTIINPIEDPLKPPLDISELRKPPTPEEPLIFFNEISIKRNQKKILEIGYFNKDDSNHNNVKMGLNKCMNKDGREMLTIPIMNSSIDKIPSKKVVVYKVIMDIINKDEYITGTYVCTLIAHNAENKTEVYEKLNFFLEVTS